MRRKTGSGHMPSCRQWAIRPFAVWTSSSLTTSALLFRMPQAAWEVASQWQGPAHADLTAPAAASTAVIAALSFWDYSLVTPVGAGSDVYKATGRCFSVAAGRVSFVHGFKGAL